MDGRCCMGSEWSSQRHLSETTALLNMTFASGVRQVRIKYHLTPWFDEVMYSLTLQNTLTNIVTMIQDRLLSLTCYSYQDPPRLRTPRPSSPVTSHLLPRFNTWRIGQVFQPRSIIAIEKGQTSIVCISSYHPLQRPHRRGAVLQSAR